MDGLIEVLISERLWLATHSESFNAYKNTEIFMEMGNDRPITKYND